MWMWFTSFSKLKYILRHLHNNITCTNCIPVVFLILEVLEMVVKTQLVTPVEQ